MAPSRGLRYDGHQSGIPPIAPFRPAFRSTIRAIGTPPARSNWQNCVRKDSSNRANEAARTMAQTQQRNIRFTAEQWERIENAAHEREVSPNQLVADLALEALDRREWPRHRGGNPCGAGLSVRRAGPRPRPDRRRTRRTKSRKSANSSPASCLTRTLYRPLMRSVVHNPHLPGSETYSTNESARRSCTRHSDQSGCRVCARRAVLATRTLHRSPRSRYLARGTRR